MFAASRKKDSRPKWTIEKHELNKNIKYMSVGNFGILSTIVGSEAHPAYHSLCIGLEYLLKNTLFYSKLS